MQEFFNQNVFLQVLQYGITTVVGFQIISILVKSFQKKQSNDIDVYTKLNQSVIENFNKVMQNGDIERKEELNEIKKLILNKSNMSTTDFHTYLKTACNLLYFNMLNEFGEIIEENHITTNTIDIANSKIKNINQKLFSSLIYELNNITYDKSRIAEIIKILNKEKDKVETEMSTLILDYVNSDLQEEEKISMSKRKLKELLKSILNNLQSHINNYLIDINNPHIDSCLL